MGTVYEVSGADLEIGVRAATLTLRVRRVGDVDEADEPLVAHRRATVSEGQVEARHA